MSQPINRYGRKHIDESRDEIRMLLSRDVSSVLIRSTSGSIGAKAVGINGAVPIPGFKGINERHSVAVSVADGDGDARS